MGRSVRGLVYVVLLVPLLFASTAVAQGVYIGGVYGSTSASIVNSYYANGFDTTSQGYKLFVGYEFMPYLGIEGAWAYLGQYATNPSVIPYAGWVNADGYSVSVVGNLPLGKVVTLYGTVGYAFWHAWLTGDARLLNLAVAYGFPLAATGSDPVYGAGLRLNFGNFAIQGGWERYDTTYVKADFYSLGARYRF